MPSSAQLRELLQTEPDDLFLRYALAKACVSEGDVAAGLGLFDEVIARDADHVASYFQKAQILAEQQQIDVARQSLHDGIEAARRTGDSHAEAEMAAFLDAL